METGNWVKIDTSPWVAAGGKTMPLPASVIKPGDVIYESIEEYERRSTISHGEVNHCSIHVEYEDICDECMESWHNWHDMGHPDDVNHKAAECWHCEAEAEADEEHHDKYHVIYEDTGVDHREDDCTYCVVERAMEESDA